MPKESVFGEPRVLSETEATGGDFYGPPWRVDVAWGRDTNVQVATLTNDGFGIKTVDPESPDGLWVTMERAAINRLIRALRKARDQAFGADE